jgi:MYXO-CTERM domain-containing protein
MLAVVMLAALVLVVTEPGPASIVALIWLFGVVLFVGLRRRAAGRTDLPSWLSRLVARIPQMREEQRQRSERRLLLQQDRNLERRLSFAGRAE